MILSFDPDTHPCHALHKRENTRLIFILFTDDRVNFQMSKLGTQFHDCGAIFDAPTENFPVLTDSFCFRTTAELFGQVDVFYGQKPQIHVVVEYNGPPKSLHPFTINRERGIIKPKEQKNHDTKDVHSGIQDEASPRGGP